MLSSITPLGQRGRGMSWSRTVIAFWIGAVLAGLAVFSLVSAIGGTLGLSDANPWFAFSVVGLALILDAAGVNAPGPHRQVDEDWLGAYRDWVVGLGFGAQLGSGLMTIVPSYGTWAIILVAGSVSPWSGAAMGVGFGLGRSLLLVSTRRIMSTAKLSEAMSRFARAENLASALSTTAYIGVIATMSFDVV